MWSGTCFFLQQQRRAGRVCTLGAEIKASPSNQPEDSRGRIGLTDHAWPGPGPGQAASHVAASRAEERSGQVAGGRRRSRPGRWSSSNSHGQCSILSSLSLRRHHSASPSYLTHVHARITMAVDPVHALPPQARRIPPQRLHPPAPGPRTDPSMDRVQAHHRANPKTRTRTPTRHARHGTARHER
jgi:hypothetical protein